LWTQASLGYAASAADVPGSVAVVQRVISFQSILSPIFVNTKLKSKKVKHLNATKIRFWDKKVKLLGLIPVEGLITKTTMNLINQMLQLKQSDDLCPIENVQN